MSRLLAVLATGAVFAASCDSGSGAPTGDAQGGQQAEVSPQPKAPDRFADRVVSFVPGETAGYGQASMPQVVLGPPRGAGDNAGGLDVVSLGKGGEIVVAFDDWIAVDGPGPDFIVFENPFLGFVELGEVSVSADGQNWASFPCGPGGQQSKRGGPTPAAHCAGLHPVFSSPANGISALDPALAGGDAFDLANVGLSEVRYVRIRDLGTNEYLSPTGGFDLDAVAVVNAREWTGTTD